MPLHIPTVAGETTDLYEVVGTSGDDSAENAWTDIEEMTKTLTLSTGDKVKITFEAVIYIPAASYAFLRIRANGVTNTPFDERIGTQSTNSGTVRRRIRNIHDFYEAVADGDVTFVVQWKKVGAATIYGNEWKLIMEHIHS